MFKRPLHHKTPLASIQRQLDRDRQLTHRVRELLPDQLQSHCLYCAQKANTLLLYTDSSVWASRLFYQRTAILAGLSGSSCEPLRIVKTRVIPAKPGLQPPVARKKPRPKLSKLIRQGCDSSRDDDLKQSLLRLADALDAPSSSG